MTKGGIDRSFSSSLEYFKRAGSPIVAVATALGGPVAVLRVSTSGSLVFLKTLLGNLPQPGSFAFRALKASGRILDNALVLHFQSPHSFTGENVVEIQTHGVPALVEEIVEAIVRLGASPALPGEFSFRATLNNKMSLEQAEALQTALSVEGMGASWASKLLAMSPSSEDSTARHLEECIKAVQMARGRVEAAIDFSEAETEQAADIASALDRIAEVDRKMAAMLTGYDAFCASAGEARIAIVGEPNVGKSTLLNLLVGGNRALVSPLAGTTRDVIESRVKLPGGEWVRFLDTAGMRLIAGVSGPGHEQLEEAGMEMGLEAAKHSAVVIWVRSLERSEDSSFASEIRQALGEEKLVELCSHADLLAPGRTAPPNSFNFNESGGRERDVILAEVERHLKVASNASTPEHFDLVISKRQGQLLRAALAEISQAREALVGERPIEISGQYLRAAEDFLKRALGRDQDEGYIEEIFRQFCLGK